MSYDLIFSLGKKVLSGGELTFEEALSLTQIAEEDVPLLLAVANKVREKFTGKTVDTCEIVNARSGNCSEDCKFCAQSVHHEVKFDAYPLMKEEDIVAAAQKAQKEGAYRFSIVTAGCGMDQDKDFDSILKAVRRIVKDTNLHCCCSLGLLRQEHAAALKEAGATRYHHNLEASASYFSEICTTHTYEERVETVKSVKAAGMQICSGGILGMGESWKQRVELAFALKELDVDAVPINILNAIPGTALAEQKKIRPLEILQAFAVFRMILPRKSIRYAGGREHALGELAPLGFLSGINGMLLGNYLTTSGRGPAEDLQTVTDLGLRLLSVGER